MFFYRILDFRYLLLWSRLPNLIKIFLWKIKRLFVPLLSLSPNIFWCKQTRYWPKQKSDPTIENVFEKWKMCSISRLLFEICKKSFGFFSFKVSQKYCSTNRTGTYDAQVRLNNDVPELLPISGRRIRVSYPGIH